jgi:hypothetical protein
LVEDFFFLDAGARVSQDLISLTGSQADATINPDNRTTTGSWNITPRIQQRFGSFADFRAALFDGRGSFRRRCVFRPLFGNIYGLADERKRLQQTQLGLELFVS